MNTLPKIRIKIKLAKRVELLDQSWNIDNEEVEVEAEVLTLHLNTRSMRVRYFVPIHETFFVSRGSIVKQGGCITTANIGIGPFFEQYALIAALEKEKR